MNSGITLAAAAIALGLGSSASAQAAEGPTDPQIAHIAYSAGAIDISAAKQALERSKDPKIRAFAEEMVRDHDAVNRQALALVQKLKVTPQDNPTSAALNKQAEAAKARLATLEGAAFDRAYVQNEIAYHKAVNSALQGTLIPSADNAELKSLLQTGLTLFREHQMHAEHLSADMR